MPVVARGSCALELEPARVCVFFALVVRLRPLFLPAQAEARRIAQITPSRVWAGGSEQTAGRSRPDQDGGMYEHPRRIIACDQTQRERRTSALHEARLVLL